jgi:hypothetical protein
MLSVAIQWRPRFAWHGEPVGWVRGAIPAQTIMHVAQCQGVSAHVLSDESCPFDFGGMEPGSGDLQSFAPTAPAEW